MSRRPETPPGQGARNPAVRTSGPDGIALGFAYSPPCWPAATPGDDTKGCVSLPPTDGPTGTSGLPYKAESDLVNYLNA
jgi:hypothetical protein